MLWDEPKIFFLERRYFFSIILSEFLKNRVALQQAMHGGTHLCVLVGKHPNPFNNFREIGYAPTELILLFAEVLCMPDD